METATRMVRLFCPESGDAVSCIIVEGDGRWLEVIACSGREPGAHCHESCLQLQAVGMDLESDGDG